MNLSLGKEVTEDEKKQKLPEYSGATSESTDDV